MEPALDTRFDYLGRAIKHHGSSLPIPGASLNRRAVSWQRFSYRASLEIRRSRGQFMKRRGTLEPESELKVKGFVDWLTIVGDDSRRGKPMPKSATFALALALLLAAGCAAHEQRAALDQRCNTGDQVACQQLAQDEAPAPYPPNQTVQANPGGSPGVDLPVPPGPSGGPHVGGISAGGFGGFGGLH